MATQPLMDSVILEGYRSMNEGEALWSVKVELSEKCKWSPAVQPARCERIRELVSEVAAHPPAPARPRAVPEDEVLYRIGWTLSNTTTAPVPVAFEAPKICKVSPKAEIRCEESALTPAQKLLIELRALREPRTRR